MSDPMNPGEEQPSPEAPAGGPAGEPPAGKPRDFLAGAASGFGAWFRPLIVPLIPGLLAVGVTYVLWLAAGERQSRATDEVVTAQAGWLRTEVQRDLDARQRAIADLAERVAAAPGPDAASWQALTSDLAAGSGQFRAVVWMDTSRTPALVAPPDERYLAALDSADDAVRQVAMDEALGYLTPGQTSITTATISLAGGAREVLVLAPVPPHPRPRGYVVGVIRARDLLDATLRGAFSRGYSVAVYEGPYQIFGPVLTSQGPEVLLASDVAVAAGALMLRLEVWPGEDAARVLNSPAATVILVLGMIVAFLSSVIVYLLRFNRGRAPL